MIGTFNFLKLRLKIWITDSQRLIRVCKLTQQFNTDSQRVIRVCKLTQQFNWLFEMTIQSENQPRILGKSDQGSHAVLKQILKISK